MPSARLALLSFLALAGCPAPPAPVTLALPTAAAPAARPQPAPDLFRRMVRDSSVAAYSPALRTFVACVADTDPAKGSGKGFDLSRPDGFRQYIPLCAPGDCEADQAHLDASTDAYAAGREGDGYLALDMIRWPPGAGELTVVAGIKLVFRGDHLDLVRAGAPPVALRQLPKGLFPGVPFPKGVWLAPDGSLAVVFRMDPPPGHAEYKIVEELHSYETRPPPPANRASPAASGSAEPSPRAGPRRCAIQCCKTPESRRPAPDGAVECCFCDP